MDRLAQSSTTDRHSDFALALLDAVPAVSAENVVVSPWSVSSALAVLAPGCDPQARTEVERALVGGSRDGGSFAGADDPVAELAADATMIAGEPCWSGDSLLTVANTLWVDDGRTPLPSFTAALDRWPGAALRFAPIAADPEGTRRTINADVAATTRDLIPEILPSGALTPLDRAVIVNALYLFTPWLEPFAASWTEDAPFHGPGGTRAVPTMRAIHDLAYARDEAWEYVGLPLDLGFHAEVLLPLAGGDGVNTLPDAATLLALRRGARTHRVDLQLPRFRAERQTVLIGPLQALGVRRIFSDLAVTRVVAKEFLWIAGAYHAAVLRVDETGVEGAAATGLIARGVAYRQLPTVEVRVDRPFLLLVTHQRTGAIAFVARVGEP
ncbi:MAG: serpin family protein [Acidimicrobiales bacterium]